MSELPELQKAAPKERMTCWKPSCGRTHLLFRDGAGWWWCWRHWRSHTLSHFGGRWPKEVRW